MNSLTVHQPQRPRPGRLTAQKNISGYIERVDGCQLLVNRSDTALAGVSRSAQHDRLPIEMNRPGIRQMDTRDNLHEGRLPRAIFSDECDNLAFCRVKTN